jgi:hypothetical protein
LITLFSNRTESTMPMVASPDDPDEGRGIVPFTFPGTGQGIRVVRIDGEPWWVAIDVCAVLDIGNSRQALARLDEDEKGVTTTDTPGGQQEVATVNEPGLYSLMLRSRKPQAKAFKRWITHEVIPAIRETGRYEAPAVPEPPRELAAAGGPLPYRDQAELLVILRPVLPELYVTATGKVILARAMGERPELLPGETPLYAATFLAEKGHRPATVAKFQSGFGQRVSNTYFKVHGRRPEKIPGPAGSRIDKVAVYTDDDRPLMEQVYAGMVDVIRAFESGGQRELSA